MSQVLFCALLNTLYQEKLIILVTEVLTVIPQYKCFLPGSLDSKLISLPVRLIGN